MSIMDTFTPRIKSGIQAASDDVVLLIRRNEGAIIAAVKKQMELNRKAKKAIGPFSMSIGVKINLVDGTCDSRLSWNIKEDRSTKSKFGDGQPGLFDKLKSWEVVDGEPTKHDDGDDYGDDDEG